MAALTDDQILVIRGRAYLGDRWKDSPSYQGVNQSNVATQSDFFTNDEIRAMDDALARDFSDTLDFAESEATAARLAAGDDQSDADTAGAAARDSARFHLIAGYGLDIMADDPRFTSAHTIKGASIDENRKAMRRQAVKHFMAAGVTIELER